MVTCVRTCCRRKTLTTFVWLAACLGWAASVVSAGIEPDFLMDSDPELRIPQPVKDFNPELAILWIEALKRPEIDMQRMAAETIARAHQYGIPDLAKAVPRLEEIVVADSSHPAARFAAARALIVLDSRESSDKLFRASQAWGADLRQLVEPALAAWGTSSAKIVWMERIGSAETRPRDLILAIRGLGEIGDQSALPELLSITSDLTRNAASRLEAATAAGKIAETGLEQRAERLVGNTRTPLFVNQICAIRLLARHSSEAATRLLVGLASHEEPAVAGTAMQRLNEIDFSLVLPLAESAMQSSDPLVRRQGATCMLKLPEVTHVEPLSRLLSDPHPGVRRDVCEGLYQLSEKPDLSELIRDAALEVLAGDRWQGQEQASLLLGILEHQPAADGLVELLESPRMEVRVASAWALRKVAVQETIPAMIEHATRQTERRKKEQQPGLDEQVAHLFEAFGVLQATDARQLLLDDFYFKKTVRQNNLSRGAAFWAIGRLYEGRRDKVIEDALVARLDDFTPQPYEIPLVKQMSAIALGRMQAVDHAQHMRDFATSIDSESAPADNSSIRLKLALGWAVRELTGEELPPPEPLTVGQGSWFLEPLQ